MLEPARAGHPASAAEADDRRQYERFRCRPRPAVRFVRRLSFRSAQAYLMDISAGGVGLLVGRRVERGTVVLVQLPCPRGQSGQPRLARVVNVRPYVSGGWVLGCQLESVLDEEELATLRQHIEAASEAHTGPSRARSAAE